MGIEPTLSAWEADRPRVCIKTARNWCLMKEDPIPSYKVGNVRRIRKEVLVSWIEDREKAELR
ncbi:hypothetical protein UB51_15720 [Paenibacillus sp. IHBB 10380]|nr:hypothetical protein UB51_15720 [Paenibacillus sp. IHBB 10380]